MYALVYYIHMYMYCNVHVVMYYLEASGKVPRYRLV